MVSNRLWSLTETKVVDASYYYEGKYMYQQASTIDEQLKQTVV